jgi:hypothetical protein
MGDWVVHGQQFHDAEDRLYIVTYRMDKAASWDVHREYCNYFAKADTKWRLAVASAKHMAVFIDWLATGATLTQVSQKYQVSVGLAHHVVRDVSDVFARHMLPKTVVMPKGADQQQVVSSAWWSPTMRIYTWWPECVWWPVLCTTGWSVVNAPLYMSGWTRTNKWM